MTLYLWYFIVLGGPVVLGAIIAFDMMKRRQSAKLNNRPQAMKKLCLAE